MNEILNFYLGDNFSRLNVFSTAPAMVIAPGSIELMRKDGKKMWENPLDMGETEYAKG